MLISKITSPTFCAYLVAIFEYKCLNKSTEMFANDSSDFFFKSEITEN